MVVLRCKFLSILAFKSHPIVIRMGDTTFLATWEDSYNVGVVYLTEAELKEFTTGSDKGEHITSMLKTLFSLVSCILSGLRQEILMEMDDFAFKLRLRFDIRSMAPAEEERSMPQMKEEVLSVPYRSMCHIST